MLICPYPTKKALKASVGTKLAYRETSMFGAEYKDDGILTVAGPTEFHKWYANVTMAAGIIQKVKQMKRKPYGWYTCTICKRKKTAWIESECYKLKLCPTHLDERK